MSSSNVATVDWERGYEDDAVLWFQNIGADPAYEVELVVDNVEKGHRERQTTPQIHPAGKISVRLQTWADEAHAEWEDLMRSSHNIIAVPSFTARARIVRKSAEGVPASQDWPELRL